MSSTLNIIVRVFIDGVLRFEGEGSPDVDDMESVRAICEKHLAMIPADSLHLVEIEFLDEPDPNRRFFRFGTDPAGMVMPTQIELPRSKKKIWRQ